MGFNRESAKRVAKVTRRIETTPINDIGASPQRRPVVSGGTTSIKTMTLLKDDFGTEQQNGETVNALDDDKYYLLNTSNSEGKYWEGNGVICGKDTSGTWIVLSDGYRGGRVKIKDDMGAGGASASGVATLGSGLEVNVTAYGDLTGLKAGHECQIVWDTEYSEFVVVTIDDRVSLGQAGTGGFGDYDSSNPLGANISNGSTVIGIYVSGTYVITGAACP